MTDVHRPGRAVRSLARTIPLAELSAADRARWSELARDAIEPNVFFEPEFVTAAAAALPARGLALAVVADGQQWTACAPVSRPRAWHRVPLTGLVTWPHAYCFLGTPLVRPGAESAIRPLVRHLRHGDAGAFVGFDNLAWERPVAQLLREALAVDRVQPIVFTADKRAFLSRRDDKGDGYLALRAKQRRNFARLRRRMEARLGGELTVRDRSSDPAAVEEFLRLEHNGWKGRRGTSFIAMGHSELLRTLARSYENLGRLEMLALQCGERTVAMKCNLRAGEGVFCFKIAFDESLRDYSPGVQLEIETVKRFESQAVRWMDSCADPSNEMINRLWPDRIEIANVAVPASGGRGALARPLVAGGRRVRERMRGTT